MRFVFNTRVDDPASHAAITGLCGRLQEAGADATLNDWSGYAPYDVAVFLGYDHELERAKREHPGIRVVLADPKQSRAEWLDAARRADLLLVSSVEQREPFLRVNGNVHVFEMFPVMAAVAREHRNSERVVVGYHGNRVHLEAMAASVRPALEELGRRRSVEFHAVYNVAALGQATIGMPDERFVRVRHVQWSDEAVASELAGADIGIVPNELPIRDRLRALRDTAYREPEFMYEPFDHLLRFKASTNAGRIYPFARLGVPVVTDFAPSASQLVEDGVSGFVVSGPHGWLDALERLAESAELRNRFAAALRARIVAVYDRQVPAFLDACAAPQRPAPPALTGVTSPEEELALLSRFPAPGRRDGSRVGALLRRFSPR